MHSITAASTCPVASGLTPAGRRFQSRRIPTHPYTIGIRLPPSLNITAGYISACSCFQALLFGHHRIPADVYSRVSMPSLSGWRLQGSPYSSRVSWADRALCERSVDRCLPKPEFERVKVRKRRLTCVRALPGFEATISALASTSRQNPDATPSSSRLIFFHFASLLLRRLSVLFSSKPPAAAGHSMAVQRGCPAFSLASSATSYPDFMPFLGPRFRAGLCDSGRHVPQRRPAAGFYALGFGLGFATNAVWRAS